MSSIEQVKKNPIAEVVTKAKNSTLFWVVSFTVLTALSAQVIVPVEPVPFTLQTMLVLLTGAFLGSKNGFYSQALYLILGIVGLPVFAGFSFGFVKIFGPTGGYLLSFPFAAYLVGYLIEKNKSTLTVILTMMMATLLILLVGASYLSIFFNGNFKEALYAGAVIFSVWGIIKTAAAISVYLAMSKKYPKLPSR